MNSKIKETYWSTASGKQLANDMHDCYWEALETLTAMADSLVAGAASSKGQTAKELAEVAKLVRAAHDSIATLNDRLMPNKTF